MKDYIGLIHKEEATDYGVSFPDLPGCITAGRSLEEARAMAEEALALHLKGLAADGGLIPQPTSPSDLAERPECGTAEMILVRVTPPRP